MYRKYGLIFLVFSTFFLWGCKHEYEEESGRLTLNFEMEADGVPLVYHVLDYQNDAGNRYQVDEIKFFISDVQLSRDGERKFVSDHSGIHYYDSHLPNTASWNISDEWKAGGYDSIAFVFGLLPSQNLTGSFVNPPENNMSWPDVLGGGYHYMQINGRWLAAGDTLRPFNLHTGIGQTYENGEITGYVHNCFRIALPLTDFRIPEGGAGSLTLVMNVNNWFRTPHRIDWNEIGGSIMQNQEVQQQIKENGKYVFSVRI